MSLKDVEMEVLLLMQSFFLSCVSFSITNSGQKSSLLVPFDLYPNELEVAMKHQS